VQLDEGGQRAADRRGVARIVIVADRQSEVIERGHGAAVFGLKSCQKRRPADATARLPLS
jgi:hypothetical protein